LPDAGPGCTSVPGTFENFGVSTNGDRVVMTMMFFPLRPTEQLLLNYERLAVTKLSITITDESSLVIQGWVEDELLFEGRLTSDEFECREQALVLRTSNWGIDTTLFVPIVHRTSAEYLLSRAEDGALIIETHEISSGVLAVVPIALKAQQWLRFEPSPASRAPADRAKLPRGVRQSSTPIQVLRPPDGTPNWSGYERAILCLAKVRKDKGAPLPTDSSLLGGRSTQAFLLQGIDGGLAPQGVVRGNDWFPATHDLRVEKQHREAPELADRYVLCLLEKGYRWEDSGNGDPGGNIHTRDSDQSPSNLRLNGLGPVFSDT
jgi:hypothetical protein